ncbi:hypothetical protein A1O7_00638 [Cladophialophora yegresii CBS 114405]|uniref:MARVEL domain-containing protein n=1 Tax=Cladophialophora yegresii CBS 114405 TaxID=1182544 RepID=W9W878_9EURO|nr:uncharacterized protein A1O7_00638 [Cladophialophora yegresii CBS 114405]EXJ64302.1 hypothetical protein A1O7_00638 [Cladophialophora yegresii CBS 114405]
MIYVLYKFYSTRDIFMEDRPWGPWAKDRVVWPTFMFAAASIVTSLIALVALIALCWRSKRRLVFFSLVYVAMDIITWVIVAIVYRVEKTEKDLWGWSCTDKAKAIQQQLGKQADFTSLCKLQRSSWVLSLSHIITKILTSALSWSFGPRTNWLEDQDGLDVALITFDQLTG